MSSIKIKAKTFFVFNKVPNKMSGKYQIDLGDLSVKAQAALESIGLDIRNKEKQGDFITVKSKYPINLYDDDGQVIEYSLANGSEGVFEIDTYSYTNPTTGQKGVGAKLVRNVITNPLEYAGGVDSSPLTADLDEAL